MDFIQTANKQVDKFGTGKHGFSAGNPAGGVPATFMSSAWCDNVQQEIVNLIEGAGTAINPAQQNQAARSIQSGKLITAQAGGTADAITTAFTLAISSLTDGMFLFVRAASANVTTTPTFTPASGTIAAKTIVKGAGAALAAGDIAGAGHWIELQYDQTLDKWVLLNPATGVAVNNGIPQNAQSANYALQLSDANKHLLHPSADVTARTFTIPANATVAFPIGTAVTFVNQNGAGAVTIAITTDTMRLAGVGSTGNRTLAANGIATALKITATEWIISGTGLS